MEFLQMDAATRVFDGTWVLDVIKILVKTNTQFVI